MDLSWFHGAARPINVEHVVKNNQLWEICVHVCEQIVILQAVASEKKKKTGSSDENFSFFRRDVTTPRTRCGMEIKICSVKTGRLQRPRQLKQDLKRKKKKMLNIVCKRLSENRFSCALKQSAAELSAPFRRTDEKEIEHRLSCYVRSLL